MSEKLNEIRERLTERKARQAAASEELDAIHAKAGNRALLAGEQERFDRLVTQTKRLDDEIESLTDQWRSEVEAEVKSGGGHFEYPPGHDPGDRARQLGGLRGRALAQVEAIREAPDDVKQRVTALVEADTDDPHTTLTRWAAVTSTPEYRRAWAKWFADPTHGHLEWTGPERDAWGATREVQRTMSVGTNTAGGFMVPTHLDPAIMLSSAGTQNVIRKISRVVTLAAGNVWNGITSAGVTISWDGELTEVSDDSPTIAQAAIPVHKAQGLIQASIEATEDTTIGAQVAYLFADAVDTLQAAAHATGTGSGQPTGIFTALDADTNVELLSTTAATIGLVDLQTVYRSVPARFRPRAVWLMNPLYAMAVQALGTAVSATFTGDLTQPPVMQVLGKTVHQCDEAPSTQTTTVRDNEIVFGDFNNYIIVDRVGATIEFIPHLFNTANNLPDGRRGFYLHFRSGAEPGTTNAFRLLQDKTSA